MILLQNDLKGFKNVLQHLLRECGKVRFLEFYPLPPSLIIHRSLFLKDSAYRFPLL